MVEKMIDTFFSAWKKMVALVLPEIKG
jgi:hypothetical protein